MTCGPSIHNPNKNPVGRPRTASLAPEEMIKLGEEMVDWVIKNKPIHLSQWYTVEKDITDKDWDAMRKIPEFIHYYTKALKIVGYQYLDKDSTVDVRIKDRWQRVYFKDLREQEDADADAQAIRQKQVDDANLKQEARELSSALKEQKQVVDNVG